MENINPIIITRDNFLREAIRLLFNNSSVVTNEYYIDVDSFDSLKDLYRNLKVMSSRNNIRPILISRGLWLSRVLSSSIDLCINDDIKKWHLYTTKKQKKSMVKLIDKIERIMIFEGMNADELKVIRALGLTNNISTAVKMCEGNYKSFMRRSLSVAKKLNLQTTSRLHLFLYAINK